MKTRWLSCLLLISAWGFAPCSFAQEADCTYPREPSVVPNGSTATQQEMLDGMTATKEYNAKVTEYLACLDKKMDASIASAGPEASAELIAQIKSKNAKQHNAAIEALEAHAARFNQEVRTFKARDKEKS